MRILMLSLLALTLTATPSLAETPKRVKSIKKLKEDQGVVLLSVRSQAVLSQKFRIWFLREGGDENVASDILVFSRAQGFGGRLMTQSLPKTYSVTPGRYKLFAHMEGCNGLPPEGQTCVTKVMGSISPNPTARYGGEVPAFEIEAGKLTNAGEFMLEWPVQTGFSINTVLMEPQAAKIRWKPVPQSAAKKLASLPKGQKPTIPEEFRSNIKCKNLKMGFIKPLIYPFEC